MANLGISIKSHHRREDGSFPISISVSHNRETSYISTGKRAFLSQLSKKSQSTFRIKDNYLLKEVLDILNFYDRELLGVSLENHSAKSLSRYLESKRQVEKIELIDFISFGRSYIQRIKLKQPGQSRNLQTLLNSLLDFTQRPMLYTSEINRRFLEDFQAFLTTPHKIVRTIKGKEVTSKGGLVDSYSRMKDFRTLFYSCKREFNREDDNFIPIPHNPFLFIKIIQPSSSPRGLEMKDIVPLYLTGGFGRDM